jgi:hypothetical protein
LFSNLATDHFSGEFFSKVSTSGHNGSNDIGLKSLSCTMGCKSLCKYLKIALQTIKGMNIYWSI